MKAKWQILALTLVCASLAVTMIQFAKSQDSNTVVSVVPSKSSVRTGETLKVNLTISNVQNLYALDLTLDWNNSILQLQNINLNLGVKSSPQPHPNGVLYGNQVSDSIVPGAVYVNASQATNEYHLIATSVAPSDSFNGSGTIATLTFNVLSNGHSSLTLQSDLADHPEPGETTSESIVHNNVSGSVDVGTIPEFPEVAILAFLAVFATVFLLFSKRILKKTS
jgi:hypothetical protein